MTSDLCKTTPSSDLDIRTELAKILSHYELPQHIQSCEALVQGHINTTYRLLLVEEGKSADVVVQKINQRVFREPIRVMENAEVIACHAAGRQGPEDCGILFFITALDGRNYVVCGQDVWRVSYYVANAIAYDTVEDPEVLRRAAWAFGRFQWLLADLPAARIHETIPHFHDTPKRLQDLFTAAGQDPLHRARQCQELLRWFRDHQEQAARLTQLVKRGDLPVRITHNDTKINNILMDRSSGQPLMIIDLDTVMPGLTAHDFGDAIRTAASTAAEDEVDIQLVKLHWQNFCAFSDGFLAGCGSVLTATEVQSLVLGAWTITVEQAARFLTDYLLGDIYYRTHYPEHNLDRARCQWALAEDITCKWERMESYIRNQ